MFCLLPPNEVEVAEVLDIEHAEDRTGGKRTNGTFNDDMANEMEMSAEKCATQIPFTLSLEPLRCAHVGKVQYELCTVRCAREKCASARVQVGVVFTPPSQSRLFNSDSTTSEKFKF